jgi:hypothetical protein
MVFCRFKDFSRICQWEDHLAFEPSWTACLRRLWPAGAPMCLPWTSAEHLCFLKCNALEVIFLLYPYIIFCSIFNTYFLDLHCTNFSVVCCYYCMQGCSLSIWEDLLNKYDEDMVNCHRTASNNSLQDALTSFGLPCECEGITNVTIREQTWLYVLNCLFLRRST